jgi:ceramide glucosyltransferase
MDYWIAALMTAVLVALGLLLLHGRSWGSDATGGAQACRPPSWPKVSLIVPVAGVSDGMDASLRSLIGQNYPAYEILWVTRDPEDVAVPLIQRLMHERAEGASPRIRHLTAGPAVNCGQKNQNLLAGVKSSAVDTEVLVFADSTHEAPLDWLSNLVAPIALHQTAITTSYHHVLPGTVTLPILGRTASVLALYRLHECRFITQPWGGNTAISRALFERLRVADTWEDNVVDDVSLALLLHQAGLRATTVREACLSTPMTVDSYSAWRRWLTRQWLYLKFCFPGTWAAAGIFLAALAGLTALAGSQAVLLLTGSGPSPLRLASLLFLAGLAGIGLSLRRFHPQPGPLPHWLAAVATAVFVAAWSHVKTWCAREIHWRGIRYGVGRKGKVIYVRDGS